MDHEKVVTDLFSHRSGDFGSPGVLGRVRTSTPVCIDAIGETWAGYITEGTEKGRMVLVTVCNAGVADLAGRQILAFSEKAVHVRHPNVLAFLDVAREGETFGLVSEYLDGEPLSTLLSAADAQSVPLPQGVALSIIKESIDALVSLRNKNPRSFPFGGLSPDVIFVAAFGETMLRNPGIEARAMTLPECRKHPSALPYRAPEQMQSPMRLQETVDVFSAGVILWELLSGRPLFGGKSHLRLGRLKALPPDQIKEMEHRVRTLQAPNLATIQRPGGALHPEVIALVDSMLRPEPMERPRTLLELSQRIAALPQGLVASPVEIAATVERLAGRAIQRRQRALQDGAHVPVFGSKPPSSRVTSAPDEGDRTTVEIPAGRDVGHLGALLEPAENSPPQPIPAPRRDLLDQRRSTSPMRPAIDHDPFDVKTKTPHHERARPPSARGTQLTPAELSPLSSLTPLSSPEADEDHTTHTPAGHQLPVTRDGSSRGGLWIAAALVALIAGGGLGLSIYSQKGAASRAGTDEEGSGRSQTEDPANAETESGALPGTLPTAPTASQEARERETDAAVEEADEPQAEDSPAPGVVPPRSAPLRPRPAGPTPKKRTDDSAGAFRPMGI